MEGGRERGRVEKREGGWKDGRKEGGEGERERGREGGGTIFSTVHVYTSEGVFLVYVCTVVELLQQKWVS